MRPTTRDADNRHGGHWYSPRAWLPWAGFRPLALPWHAHTTAARAMTRQEARHNALLVLAVLFTLATVGCAAALPALELPISVIGALLVTALVIVGSGRAGEMRATIREMRITLEESSGGQSAPGLHLVPARAWLLDVLLDWQARRAEVTNGEVLGEGDHDHDHDREDRATATATVCGRDLGIYLHGSEDGPDRARDADHEQGRVRGLGAGQRLPVQPGWLARPRHHNARGLHVQAPPALTSPAAEVADETHEQRAKGVARG